MLAAHLTAALLAAPLQAATIGMEADSCQEGQPLSVWIERGDTGFGSSCVWSVDEGVAVLDESGDLLTLECPACAGGRETAEVRLYVVCTTSGGTAVWDFAAFEVSCSAPSDTVEQGSSSSCSCAARSGPAVISALLPWLLVGWHTRRASAPTHGA